MLTKTVYQCDAAGWYVGPTDAHESPLEPGVWHIPAGAVEQEPPMAEGLWPRMVAGVWCLQIPPAPPVDTAPAAKLAAFLAANPDVAALVHESTPHV